MKMPANQILNERYLLEKRLGSGGMSVVYRAQDLVLERTVAIKVLRSDFSGNAEFREHFRQEAKAAANLSHANIVTVHDFGLDADQLFIVMEYVPGTDLKSILQTQGKFQKDEAIRLIIQACSGIGYAHNAGLVHCDVKPQNMLVTPGKLLKVVDFGIARALESIHPDERYETVWGSPQYFSPEQASGLPPSPASDVYSLGVILFETLTGVLPFNASSTEELGRLHRDTPPTSPRRLDPDIPTSLESIILKALSKDPIYRYQNAMELGKALQSFNKQTSLVGSYPTVVTDEIVGTATIAEISPEPVIELQSPATFTPVQEPSFVQARPISQPIRTSTSPDWITWVLAMIAIVTIGGLIPFWIWVYYTINPPF